MTNGLTGAMGIAAWSARKNAMARQAPLLSFRLQRKPNPSDLHGAVVDALKHVATGRIVSDVVNHSLTYPFTICLYI